MDKVIVKTLSNQKLLLALDNLYRENMKEFEVKTLLPIANHWLQI